MKHPNGAPRRGAVVEAVPNFSEGRDERTVRAILEAVEESGAEVLDWSMDADHNRSVVTFVGRPAEVEEAAVAAARVAVERIDLRGHQGVHPRIGALDVLPFVPLVGTEMSVAVDLARRVGERLAREVGVPAFLYGFASRPQGRKLAELRRGGFETLAAGWPDDRRPDCLPDGWPHRGAHPTAGAVCVGARPVLLAWNINLDGVRHEDVARIAGELRERDGGYPGLRALAFTLEERGLVQLSMNLEDPAAVSPFEIFADVEARVARLGGQVVETEVIGMLPDELLFSAAADRIMLEPDAAGRLLSRRLVEYLARDPNPDPGAR